MRLVSFFEEETLIISIIRSFSSFSDAYKFYVSVILLHEKNGFAKRSKILLDTDLKIILEL